RALARDVVQPAMKGTTQAAVLKTAEGKVGAAMRAMTLNQAVTSLLVAKQHQILAKQLDGRYRARALQLVDQRRRLPVHSHQFPAGVPGPGPGHQVILFLADHGSGPFRINLTKACRLGQPSRSPDAPQRAALAAWD